MSIYPEIAGRDWQQDALQQTMARYQSGNATMLVEACPAAGKSRFAIAAAKHLMDIGRINFVVILAPTTILRDQWSELCLEHGVDIVGDTTTLLLKSYREHREGVKGAPCVELNNGICITPQLASGKDVAQDLDFILKELDATGAKRLRGLVIVDEVHHNAATKSWGDVVNDSLSGAELFLGLTGTPYRSDDNKIVLMDYQHTHTEKLNLDYSVDHLLGKPDYRYTYAQALADGIVLPMVFSRQYGVVEVDITEGDEVTSEVLDFAGEDGNGNYFHPKTGLIDQQKINARLRAFLDTEKSDFPELMLEDAAQQLSALRAGGDYKAGGLVVCVDIDAAKKANDFLNSKGYRSMLLTSKDTSEDDLAQASKVAQRFSDSYEYEWLVSVKMVNEGVDIPRLRMLTYLTNVKTLMFFTQTVARAIRLPKEVADAPLETRLQYASEHPAFVVIPADPDIQAFAASVEDDVDSAIEKVYNHFTGQTLEEMRAAAIALAETSLNRARQAARQFEVIYGTRTHADVVGRDGTVYTEADIARYRKELKEFADTSLPPEDARRINATVHGLANVQAPAIADILTLVRSSAAAAAATFRGVA